MSDSRIKRKKRDCCGQRACTACDEGKEKNSSSSNNEVLGLH